MEELIKILEKTVSPSQADQNEAVRYVQDYICRDFTGFLKALSDVLCNQQNPPVVRAAAGLQLKNQLTARDENLRHQQQERWRNLPIDTRQYIKERVFSTLGTEMFRPSSAPQCLAYIACIELPENNWPGLMQALTKNVSDPNSSSQIKLASLEALGHICQDIDRSLIEASDLENILAAVITHGIHDPIVNNDVRQAAVTTLMNFSESSIKQISRSRQSITFEKLGEILKLDPKIAEKIVAQMIREDRIGGHLNQVDKIVYFESKDVLQIFDERVLGLCSNVNDIIEEIKNVVPLEWWLANAYQQ